MTEDAHGDLRREIHVAGNGQVLRMADVEAVCARLKDDPAEASNDAIRLMRFLAGIVAAPERAQEPQQPPDWGTSDTVREQIRAAPFPDSLSGHWGSAEGRDAEAKRPTCSKCGGTHAQLRNDAGCGGPPLPSKPYPHQMMG